MKSYQIKGEIRRHIADLFAAKINAYPRLTRGAERALCFLHPKGRLASSAFLRSRQMYDMAVSAMPAYIVDDIADIRDDSVVIGTKGTLAELISAQQQGKQRNVRYLYDPVDQLLDVPKLCAPDGLIASSYRQYYWLRSISPKPVFLIPHHADLRITRQVGLSADCEIAYFGAQGNGYFSPRIHQQLKIFDTVDHQGVAWMAALADFPVHYCIRRKREKSHSYKPATKLFIAAKVGAAVITTRDESDAEYLLPPDYPYYVDQRSERAVLEMLAFVRESYATPVFAKARADVAAIRGWRESEQVQQLQLLLNLI